MPELLVHRTGGIGDTLSLTPLLAALRSRFDTITLVGNAERLALIHPDLHDRIVSFDSAERARKADCSITFSVEPKPGYQMRFPPFPDDKNIYDWMSGIAADLGGFPKDVVRNHHGSGTIIHPGSGSKLKNAPLSRFLELAPDDALFILGPAEDQGFESRISSAGHRWIRPESLSELKEIIIGADTFISNDSGPAHLAALNGLDTRIIYVSSDPRIWKPPGRVTLLPPSTPADGSTSA